MGVDLFSLKNNRDTCFNWAAWRFLLDTARQFGWEPLGTVINLEDLPASREGGDLTDLEKQRIRKGVEELDKDWDGIYSSNEDQREKIMGKTVLPKALIEEITRLHNQGFSSIEIFDAIQGEARKIVTSEAQLARCISAIGGKASLKNSDQKGIQRKKSILIPSAKPFNINQYQGLIPDLKDEPDLRKIEESFTPIVFDILKNYEGFTDIQKVNQVTGFANPPFDFFGYKKGEPYLIEFKGSLYHFNSPGETQKRRLQELRSKFNDNELHMALLQVKLKEGIYRIFFDVEMDLFFDGPQIPLDPVEKWIRQQLKINQ